ncbi:MAG: hypothetical protein HY360_10245 [Verrucomicrobia bacterium]|nr:hypothetical protein [Verrucomicrobiota bacterium]
MIENPGAFWRSEQFIEYHGNHGRGTPIRTVVADADGGHFKYIHNFGDKDELYDLLADPQEKYSLVGSNQHQVIRSDLRGRLAQWMRKTGDHLQIE